MKKKPKPKNPAAVALGRLGGLASAAGRTSEDQAAAARSGAAKMTAEQRSARARKAALARHAKRKDIE